MNPKLLTNRDNDTFKKVVKEGIFSAQNAVYLATAPIKDFVVGLEERKPIPFSREVQRMSKRGINFYILTSVSDLNDVHFYKKLKNTPNIHFARCRRNNMKLVLIDEQILYVGSADATGPGMGIRKPNNTNFELGFISEEREHILEAQKHFLEVFTGKYCNECKRRKDRRPEFRCSGIYSTHKKDRRKIL
ncbi:MAG: hypothetical protein ACFFCQ_09945 [Promethearchaeota archaeon]